MNCRDTDLVSRLRQLLRDRNLILIHPLVENEYDDDSLVAQGLNRVANWHVNRDEPEMALPLHEEALSLFRARDDRAGRTGPSESSRKPRPGSSSEAA